VISHSPPDEVSPYPSKEKRCQKVPFGVVTARSWSTTFRVLSTSGSVGEMIPNRTRSRKLGSTTRRWSAWAGPPSPMEYVVPRSGWPSLVRRRK
jgi:hypothetical protein